uniref:Chloride channel protein n=1 Tax=Chlamydomonas euryale TaxID=1486919 RepID=A0A7R9VET4_9CHLO|mmetsp:Transcript_32009/g.95610  ORF Transcript_32009/g.95610 Transcript_32009/m.95610 type:complete len:950 (+) Transcript_32009:178-3027(+)
MEPPARARNIQSPTGQPEGFAGYHRFNQSSFQYAQYSDDDDEDLLLPTGEVPLLGQPGLLGSNGVGRTCRRIFNHLFKRGREVESARMNHQFTTEERIKLNNVESIDYLPPNSASYRKWLYRQPHRREWDRWFIMGAIGMCTGLVAYLLYSLINLLANFKFGTTRWLIGHTNMGVAWLFNVLVSTALVAASSALCVGVAPEAIGSGVPEVMAYLNGCLVPRVFNIFTLLVKFLSCGLCVASGLPVGPEGPLIHIGAALGSAISQGHSTTLSFSTEMFKRFRNPKDKRDFVTAGVSVGVAAAFNAPIGGLLFAFEEVASFWQQSLGWQVFFACMMATLALNVSKSAGKWLLGSGSFGWFEEDVAFEVVVSFSSHILAVVPALIIGALAGLFGIVFTILNVKISRLRLDLSSHLKWGRMVEPIVLTVLYTTICMVLPLFFPCTPTECLENDGVLYCATGLGDQGNTSHIPENVPSLPVYTCRVVDVDDYSGEERIYPRADSIMPDLPGNGTQTVFYNQLATLIFSTGEDAIKQLMSRGTHKRFGYATLLVMFFWYFIMAAFVAGSAISSGLFVPMLMIGAIIGRMVGLGTVDIAQSLGKQWSVETSGPLTWIDPGAFALVGAGAFMGGVTRLTLSLAVIMIEVSSDVHMLLPVLTAIMTAKWVADAVTHSLYHGLLEVKCVPFLPPEPVSKKSLDLIPVSYIMHSPVVLLKERMRVREVTEALKGVSHNGFPVVRDSPSGQVFVGLLTRSHIMAVLQRIVVAGNTEVDVAWTELNRKTMDPVMAQRNVHEQQMVVLSRELQNSLMGGLSAANGAVNGSHAVSHHPEQHGVVLNGSRGGAGGLNDEAIEEMTVDLTPYMNTSTFIVPDSFSLERAYLLFRTMGLRHLVIVDQHNHVKGIVTRKDLLGYRLDEALSRAMGNHSHRGSRRADVPSLSLGGARGMPMTRSAGGII